MWLSCTSKRTQLHFKAGQLPARARSMASLHAAPCAHQAMHLCLAHATAGLRGFPPHAASPAASRLSHCLAVLGHTRIHTHHMLHELQYLLYTAALPWPLLRIHTPLSSLLYRCLSGTATPASNCSMTGSAQHGRCSSDTILSTGAACRQPLSSMMSPAAAVAAWTAMWHNQETHARRSQAAVQAVLSCTCVLGKLHNGCRNSDSCCFVWRFAVTWLSRGPQSPRVH